MTVRSLMNQDAASGRWVKNACGLNGSKVLVAMRCPREYIHGCPRQADLFSMRCVMICKILLGVALASVASTAGAATAATEVSSATLSIGKGTVLVLSSDSSQYLTAKPGQVLKPGDRVMVMQGGSAAVKYTNGQTSALAPNTLADIGASSALTFGSRTSATQKKIGPMYAQAVGDDQNKKCRGSDGKEKACDTDNDGGPAHGPDPFVIAAGIGVGVAIVALESGSNSDRHHTLPISAP